MFGYGLMVLALVLIGLGEKFVPRRNHNLFVEMWKGAEYLFQEAMTLVKRFTLMTAHTPFGTINTVGVWVCVAFWGTLVLVYGGRFVKTENGKKVIQQMSSPIISLIVFFYELSERRHHTMARREHEKDRKGATSDTEVKSSPSDKPVVSRKVDSREALPETRVDLGNLNYTEAKDAARGGFKSFIYQKRLQREAANIKTGIETEKTMTEALKTKTERLKATKELFREAGQVDRLPEKERKEVTL